jgi:RNA polymerase sigma factor (sigma-70 family)
VTSSPGRADPAEPGGDRQSDFADFYKATVQETVLAAMRACRNPHVADDATQEAFAAILASWSDRCGRAVMDNQRYVIRIALHKVADWYRLQRRWVEFDAEVVSHWDDPGYLAVLDRMTALDRQVYAAIGQQPPRRRLVGLLYFFADCTCQEIANTLEMNPQTVRSHLRLLRQNLQVLALRVEAESKEAGAHD